MNRKGIREILEHYGGEPQKLKSLEELTELQEVLIKDINKGGVVVDDIAQEIADVVVMLYQLIDIYGLSERSVENLIDFKVSRQIQRIKGEISSVRAETSKCDEVYIWYDADGNFYADRVDG